MTHRREPQEEEEKCEIDSAPKQYARLRLSQSITVDICSKSYSSWSWFCHSHVRMDLYYETLINTVDI